jgi:hypothetical protein
MVDQAPPPSSPWVWQCTDNFANIIRITVTFNNTTLALTGATVFRDAGCQWTHIYLGLGPDGTPDTSAHTFLVPAGTTAISAGQLSANGLTTYGDVTGLQITAGP